MLSRVRYYYCTANPGFLRVWVTRYVTIRKGTGNDAESCRTHTAAFRSVVVVAVAVAVVVVVVVVVTVQMDILFHICCGISRGRCAAAFVTRCASVRQTGLTLGASTSTASEYCRPSYKASTSSQEKKSEPSQVTSLVVFYC